MCFLLFVTMIRMIGGIDKKKRKERVAVAAGYVMKGAGTVGEVGKGACDVFIRCVSVVRWSAI